MHGIVSTMSCDVFAKSLLSCGDTDAGAEKVVIRKLLWCWDDGQEDLGQYRTTGACPDRVYVATPDDVRDPRPPPAAAGDAGGGGEMDFLSDMTKSIRERLQRQQQQVQQGPCAILDAIGEVRDELAAHLAEVFDDEVAGQELCGLIAENDERVEAEEREEAMEEADLVPSDLVEGAEQPEQADEVLLAAPGEESPLNIWSNMKEDGVGTSKQQYASLADGKIIGRINFINGNTKATCQAHPRCSCYVTTPRNMTLAQVVSELQLWLNDFPCSEQQHYSASIRLKRDKFGMKVRT